MMPAPASAGHVEPHAREHEEEEQHGRREGVELLKELFAAADVAVGGAAGHAGEQRGDIEEGAHPRHAEDDRHDEHQPVVLRAALGDEPAEEPAAQDAHRERREVEEERAQHEAEVHGAAVVEVLHDDGADAEGDEGDGRRRARPPGG